MSSEAGRRPLDRELLTNEVLSGGLPWKSVEVVACTGSTNADLIERARAMNIDGVILVAENQTAGRGRHGRTWSAVPHAQVTVSMGVAVAGLPTSAWGWVPLLTGLAVVDAVAEVTGVRAALKWPNDVQAGPNGRKLAGILAEVVPSAAVIVVGVGLNVSLRADELPDPAATSLVLLGAEDPDRVALTTALTRQVARRIDALRRAGGADGVLISDYVERSLTIGSRVRATLPGGREIIGDALGVDEQGRLRIDTGGAETVVSAGDIVHLRPVDGPG